MTPLRVGVVAVAVLVGVWGWWVLPTHQEAGIGVGKTELRAPANVRVPPAQPVPVQAPDPPPVPSAETFILPESGQTLRLMGVEPGPSSARFCDEANWTALGPVAERVGKDAIFVDAASWAERTARERASLASWMSKCLQEGREIAIRSSSNSDLLARYDSEHGYRTGVP